MTNRTFNFIKTVVQQFLEDNCFGRAAQLAYTTLLSLVPLFTVSFTILSAMPVFHGLTKKLQNAVVENFVATSAQNIQVHLQSFITQTTKLSAWGFLSLLVTAVLLVFSIERTFNTIWKVKQTRKSSTAFLLYWGVITFLPVLIGAGLVVSSYLMSLPYLSGTVNSIGMQKNISLALPHVMTFLSLTLMYVALPNCKVPVKNALLAAVPVTLLFEAAKQGFAFYIVHFPTYTLIYGALATIPIFLVWLYIMWVIILLGAVISHTLTNRQITT
jgi:membrane protein